MTGLPRLLIVDDDAEIRDILRISLEAECEIVGEADNGMSAIQAHEELQPDIVLLDVSMPVMDGFVAAKRIKTAQPEVRIIFVSQHSEPAYVNEAFRLGAAGYVLKTSALRELTMAVREVLSGRCIRGAAQNQLGRGI